MPFDVSVNINDDIGGPSAGLMFSLAIYDTLTPGSLTGGQVVAGTGTIDDGGQVGPIGGIQQKIAGAREAGAQLFLVPPDNCADAARAPTTATCVWSRPYDACSGAGHREVGRRTPTPTLPACEQKAQ